MPISTTYAPAGPTLHPGQGAAILNREDLSSVLTMLAPEKTPITSMASKTTAKSTLHEWGVDKLAAPQNVPVPEGKDVDAFADEFANMARLGNYVQKFRRPYLVSDLQEAADSVISNKIAAAEVKAMKELKRDIEFVVCSDADRSAQDGTGTSYAMRGLGNWISSTGPPDVAAAYRTPAASILTSAPTETTFNNMLSSIFSIDGEVHNLTGVFGRALRRVISDFTRTDNNAGETVYHVQQNATEKKVTLAVNTYDSDFGIVNIVNGNPDCMPNANRGYVINPAYIAIASYIPMKSRRLEDLGGGPRGYTDATLTLAVRDPRAHGKIAY